MRFKIWMFSYLFNTELFFSRRLKLARNGHDIWALLNNLPGMYVLAEQVFVWHYRLSEIKINRFNFPYLTYIYI